MAYIFIGVGVEGEDFRGHIVSGDETWAAYVNVGMKR